MYLNGLFTASYYVQTIEYLLNVAMTLQLKYMVPLFTVMRLNLISQPHALSLKSK